MVCYEVGFTYCKCDSRVVLINKSVQCAWDKIKEADNWETGRKKISARNTSVFVVVITDWIL